MEVDYITKYDKGMAGLTAMFMTLNFITQSFYFCLVVYYPLQNHSTINLHTMGCIIQK